MAGARSISSVLHSRLQRLKLPDLGHSVTWAQRTPKHAPAVVHELAAALDQRARALGDQLAASPEPWLRHQLGVLAPHASPLLREDYARRARSRGYLREPPGSPIYGQAIAPEPHHGNPELDHLRQAAIRALEIRDETEITRGMTTASSKPGSSTGIAPSSAPRPTFRANCGSPPKPKPTPGSSPPAPRSSTDQTGSAEQRHSPTTWRPSAERLETANARYGPRATDASDKTHGKARSSSCSGAAWRGAQLGSGKPARKEAADHGGVVAATDAGLAAVDRAVERERQAAVAAGIAWPPAVPPARG